MNNVRAHADMNTLNPTSHFARMQDCTRAYAKLGAVKIHIPGTSTVAFFDRILNLLDSCRQSKALINAFVMSGLLPMLMHCAIVRVQI